jgi:hypothetical protein
MARTDSKSQLEALRQQQLALAQKIKDAEAKEKKKQREDNERRKLLAGTAALAELAAHPDSPFAGTLLARLSAALKRPADRALFPGLPSPPAAPDHVKPSEKPKALVAPMSAVASAKADAPPPAKPVPRQENESVEDYFQRALGRSLPLTRQPPESSSS